MSKTWLSASGWTWTAQPSVALLPPTWHEEVTLQSSSAACVQTSAKLAARSARGTSIRIARSVQRHASSARMSAGAWQARNRPGGIAAVHALAARAEGPPSCRA
jgi:hypothetical protein